MTTIKAGEWAIETRDQMKAFGGTARSTAST